MIELCGGVDDWPGRPSSVTATYDPLVPVAMGRAAYESLDDGERPVEWHELPVGHEVCMSEIELVGRWLHRVLEIE